MTITDQHLLVDGARIAYADRGTGWPVVFVHGTPAHSYLWRNVAPRVEAAGYRTIVYDLLGYGASERPIDCDTSVARQVEVLDGLRSQLGLDRCTLVGHDIGGAIAQHVALQAESGLDRLVLIDTVSYDSWPSETWRAIIDAHLADYEAMPREDFEALLARQLRMTVADPSRMGGEVLEAYLAPHRSRLGQESFFEHQVRHYDARYTEELTDRLSDMALPVRLLWGAQDRWQPLSYGYRLASDIPGAELTVIQNGGHFLMEDAPDRVATELLDFLA